MEEESFEEPEKPKNKKKIIAIVAVAIIVIAGLAFALPWLLLQFGGLQWPTPGREKVQMLVIGQPSVDLLADLDNQPDLLYYRIKNAGDLEISPYEQISEFDIVLLDQHMGSTPYEKSVSRALGEAMENYVRTGGKLIVVMDSGIYRSGGEYRTGVASDVVGWKATFGDIMPVECDLGQGNIPTCTQPIIVTGRIQRLDDDHKVMEGIEFAPSLVNESLTMITFDVNPTGNVIGQINREGISQSYPGIVENRLLIGKVIYFNYDPAMTPGIWANSLEYLR